MAKILQALFEQYDSNDSGQIDASDLVQLIEALGYSITRAEANAMVQALCHDSSGLSIDFGGFLAIVRVKEVERSSEAQRKKKAGGAFHTAELIARLREETAQQRMHMQLFSKEEKAQWMHGKMVQLVNGVFAPVFSKGGLETAVDGGATEVSATAALA